MRIERCGRLFALAALAGKGLVDRLAERFPQLLLVLALQRHRVGFGLPALLQGLDRVDAQHRSRSQGDGLVDQRPATRRAFGLRGLQARVRRVHHVFPDRLDFGKRLFAQVPGFAPALGERVQLAHHGFPVGALFMRQGPGLEFLDDPQALGPVGVGLLAHLVQPGFHQLVGLGTGFVKTLPERVIGLPALVGALPLIAQAAQSLLHLAPTQALALGGQQ